MSLSFGGKKFLVTGAGRGIGRALVKALNEAGGEVYALSVTKKNLDSLVQELPTVHPIQVDLSNWEATRREVDKLPPLNGLVNNAAVLKEPCFSMDITKEEIQSCWDINVLGAVNVSQSVGRKMIQAGQGGSIVNVSSMASVRPIAGFLPYSTSKAALDMVTRQLAMDLGPHNIRVNSVNPAFTKTDMIKSLLEDETIKASIATDVPLGRALEVDEVVGPIMYLLSDLSRMVSGTMSYVDGGFGAGHKLK